MENTQRLIDANATLLAIDIHGTNKFGMLDEDIREFIKKQPTVAAVEVVHGRWIEKQDMVASYLEGCTEVFYECSVCQAPNIGVSPYCPNCGAKMDGGKNE